MKRTLTAFLLILFAGCCKEICIGGEVTISFEKFKASETTRVVFVRYPPGSTQSMDSFSVLSIVPVGDTSRSAVSQNITVDYDWIVRLPALNREYNLANFDFTTEKCNCTGDKYKLVNSFTVNGQRKEGDFIRLEK
ncbi:MAG: hypothetical protein EOO14_23885 [Chitinophagaceae bacterium]|nr:MAG: hypothetical protein EOO14_23885 [Chitinophagaceae bacterium]